MSRGPTTLAEKTFVRASLRRGDTPEQISAWNGWDIETIRALAKRARSHPSRVSKRSTLSNIERDTLMALETMSLREAGRKFGVSHQAIAARRDRARAIIAAQPPQPQSGGGRRMSESHPDGAEVRITPWWDVSDQAAWSDSFIAAYRIWQRRSQWGWEQRHEWRWRDGSLHKDDWIRGAEGWCPDSQSAGDAA